MENFHAMHNFHIKFHPKLQLFWNVISYVIQIYKLIIFGMHYLNIIQKGGGANPYSKNYFFVEAF